MILASLLIYFGILLAIGVASSRRGSNSADDYFLANRSLGTLVLFMAIFGTNVTAFALLGFPGHVYRTGIAVFGFFGAAAAFWIPLTFVLLGYPIWKIGRRNRFVTPSQMLASRWDSAAVGILVLIALVVYTVPYLLIGLMGAGIALEKLSDSQVSYSQGVVLVAVITVFYTSLGGMRGTAWTNVFQGGVFLGFLIVAFVGIAYALGGPEEARTGLQERPELLDPNSRFSAAQWITGFLVGPVSVIAFPHIFLRVLAARDVRSLRRTIAVYPWAFVLLFVPLTLIGLWGVIEFPGLEGKAADSIFPLMVSQLSPLLSAIGLVAILAAIMSSLDGQVLTMSTLASVDLVGEQKRFDPRTVGRLAVIALATPALIIALFRPERIFQISAFAFSGYTLLVPVFIAAFYWKRSTAAGILTGSIAGHGLLCLHQLPGIDLPTFGMVPVATCLIVEAGLIVAVSLRTKPASSEALERFRDPLVREEETAG